MILRILLLVSAFYLMTISTTTTDDSATTTDLPPPIVIDDDYIASLHPDKRSWRVNIILELPYGLFPPEDDFVADAYLDGLRQYKSVLAVMSTSLKTNTSSDTVKFYKLDGGMLNMMLTKFKEARDKNWNDAMFDMEVTRSRIEVAKFVPNVVNLTVRIEYFVRTGSRGSERRAQWRGRANESLISSFNSNPEFNVRILYSQISSAGSGVEAELYEMMCEGMRGGFRRPKDDNETIITSLAFRYSAFRVTIAPRAACRCANASSWTSLTECHYKMDESKDQCLETAERLLSKDHLCSQQVFCKERHQVKSEDIFYIPNAEKYCDKENVTRRPCEIDPSRGVTQCRIACENAPNSTGECNATCEEPDGYRSIDKIFEGRLKCCGLIMTDYPIFEKCTDPDMVCTTSGVQPTGDETDEPEPETTVEETIGVNVTRTTTSASGNASKEEGMSDETVIALGAGCVGGAIVAFAVLGLIVFFTYIRPRRVRVVERKIEIEKTMIIRRTMRIKARTMRLKAATMRMKAAAAAGGKSVVDPKVQATKTVVDPKKAMDPKKKATPIGKK